MTKLNFNLRKNQQIHNLKTNAKINKKDASTNTFDSYLLEKAKEEKEIEEAEKAKKELYILRQ